MAKRAVTTIPSIELEVAGPYNSATKLGNYDESRATIDTIVLHTMVGTWQSAATRFDTDSSNVSAHYGVKYDGGLIHWLEEYFTAYHSGSYSMNQRSIGIEHEDMGNYNSPRPDVLYSKSAALVADICKFYSIPCDNTHIVRHQNVSGASTACPDSLDTDRIIREANVILGGIPTPSTDDCPTKLIQITAERDRLNGVITLKDQTIASKDDTIQHLGDTITSKNNDIQILQGTVSTQATQLTNTQESLAVATEQAKKVPVLTQQVNDLTDSINGLNGYKNQISTLQTQNGTLTTKIETIKASLVPKKYLTLKAYNIIMSLDGLKIK